MNLKSRARIITILSILIVLTIVTVSANWDLGLGLGRSTTNASEVWNSYSAVRSLPTCPPPGSLDTSFDGDGVVSTPIGSGLEAASSVAVQADGKIVAAGYSNASFALARYNTDGSLDTSFNGTGKVTTTFPNAYASATSAAIRPDGKIVAAGGLSGEYYRGFALAQYNADGSLD